MSAAYIGWPIHARRIVGALALTAAVAVPALADPIGQIKTASGAVTIERAGAQVPAKAGDRVEQSDVVVTGADGACGITFLDNSMMSLGPDSSLALERFRFDSTTHEGEFQSSLRRGTLAVRSGNIVRQGPPGEAMKVRTPVAILGVRGTEFVVRADGGK